MRNDKDVTRRAFLGTTAAAAATDLRAIERRRGRRAERAGAGPGRTRRSAGSP